MTQPFEGIRVLDLTHVLAGPFATYQLAVLGADVIKIESPSEPDQARENSSDEAFAARFMGTTFLTQASNKRSLALDLKTPEGRDILKRLVPTADVLVENYRPGAMNALGLGYEEMAKLNPRLIYCSMSAFGHSGPRSTQTAYDPVIQAAAGLMAMNGTPELSPLKIGAAAVDYSTGATGAFAIASALFQRERTGRGQRIDLAMFDTALMLVPQHLTAHLHDGSVSEAARQRASLCHQPRLRLQRGTGRRRRDEQEAAAATVGGHGPSRPGDDRPKARAAGMQSEHIQVLSDLFLKLRDARLGEAPAGPSRAGLPRLQYRGGRARAAVRRPRSRASPRLRAGRGGTAVGAGCRLQVRAWRSAGKKPAATRRRGHSRYPQGARLRRGRYRPLLRARRRRKA